MNAHCRENLPLPDQLVEDNALNELRGVFQGLSPQTLRLLASKLVVMPGFLFQLAKAAAAELLFRAHGQQNMAAKDEMGNFTPAERDALYDNAL